MFRRPAPLTRPGGNVTSAGLRPKVAAQVGRVQAKLSVQPKPDPCSCTNSKLIIEFARPPDGRGLGKAAPARDAGEVDACAGVGPLHSCFAVMLIVDNNNRQIVRPFPSD